MFLCSLLVGASANRPSANHVDSSGRAIAGFAIGMLTMVVPLYISEVCQPALNATEEVKCKF